MNSEKAKKLIIEHLERDIKLHNEEKFEEIGQGFNKFDKEFPEFYTELIDNHPQLMIAWDFWDSWIDERNHGFPCFTKGMTKEKWPILAEHIVEKLSSGEEISDPFVLSAFVFKRKPSFIDKIKKLFKIKAHNK